MKICPVCQRRYPDNTLFCPEDGAGLIEMDEQQVASEESLIGRRLFGEYTVSHKLGEGGMGAVYLAQQDNIDQMIALKVLHGRSSQNDELLKRFVREAKAVSMLTHPNIIRVFIFGRTPEGLVYLAMEYVQGVSLRDVMDDGPMDELRAIRIMKQVLSAVGEAHDMGIIHRDLKPDNILLTEYRGVDDFVKVLDFGIAKVKEPDGKPEQKLTQAGVVYGTPEYLSPEQAQALELDHRTDLYSLGIILYEMITGEVPFLASSAVRILTMHAFEMPKRPSEMLPPGQVSPEIELIILKAISKKPGQRYADAMEMFNALSQREEILVRERGVEAKRLRVPGSELVTGAYGAVIGPSMSGPQGPVEAAPAVDPPTEAVAAVSADSGAEASSAAVNAEVAKAQKTHKLLLALVIGLSVVAVVVVVIAVVLLVLFMNK